MERADLFFDLDRTLWDFDRNSREAIGQIFHQHALSRLETTHGSTLQLEAFVTAYEAANEVCWAAYRAGKMDQPTLRSRRFYLALEALDAPPDVLQGRLPVDLGESYVACSPRLPHLLPGAREAVAGLHARGHRLFILTNGFESVQHLKMEHSGLAPFFDAVITSDSVGFPKPDARAFAACLERTGSTAQRAVMIGDDLVCDVGGAREAGWRQVHYNPEGRKHREQVWRTVTHLDRLLDLPL